MDETVRLVAVAINKAYATSPIEDHEGVDRVRQNIGNALAAAGIVNYAAFSDLARTIA